MTTEIVSYSATEAAIADLTARYAMVVFDVKTASGMKEAKAAYKDINTHSITLEAARVKEKAESLARFGRRDEFSEVAAAILKFLEGTPL